MPNINAPVSARSGPRRYRFTPPYHQQKVGELDLKPRTDLTQDPRLLPGLLTLPPIYYEWYSMPFYVGSMLEFASLSYRGLQLIDGLVSQKRLHDLKQCGDYERLWGLLCDDMATVQGAQRVRSGGWNKNGSDRLIYLMLGP